MSFTDYLGKVVGKLFDEERAILINGRKNIAFVLHSGDAPIDALRSLLPNFSTSYSAGNHSVSIMRPKELDEELYKIESIPEDFVAPRFKNSEIDSTILTSEKDLKRFGEYFKRFSLSNVASFYNPEFFEVFASLDVAQLNEYSHNDAPCLYFSGVYCSIPRDSFKYSGYHPPELSSKIGGTPIRALCNVPLHRVCEVIDRFGEEGKGLEKLV